MVIRTKVRQDNTWLVVDPFVGCIYDCQYCFLQNYGETRTAPKQMMSPTEAVELLASYWSFQPTSIVMVGTESDMFASPGTIAYLREFCREYEARRIPNTLCFCTKASIPDSFIDEIANRDLDCIYYISYSGLPREIEPSIDPRKLLSNFRRLRERGQRILHLWRPLTPLNSSLAQLTEIATAVASYADASIVRGLNLNKKLQEGAWYWPSAQNVAIDFSETVSVWPAEGVANMRRVIEEFRGTYPIFFKNSCGISWVLGKPDIVAEFGNDRCRSASCPEKQRQLCSVSQTIPGTEEIRHAFAAVGLAANTQFELTGRQLKVDAVLTHEQTACLAQMLRAKLVPLSITTGHEWGGYVLGHRDLVIDGV